MSRSSNFEHAQVPFPAEGAWRLHQAPAQLREREPGDPPRDRFDDPDGIYRVRYFATTRRGSMLEVLDHFRRNDAAEASFAQVVGIEGVDILEDEPAGAVPDRWLYEQRFALGIIPPAARFVDVTNSDVLAELDRRPHVRDALQTSLAIESLGSNARLDEATIRLNGPIGRRITQAVSQEIHQDSASYVGICYRTRFDDQEQCWAVFDDRIHVQFDAPQALDPLDADHLEALNSVAHSYRLTLPRNWLLDQTNVR